MAHLNRLEGLLHIVGINVAASLKFVLQRQGRTRATDPAPSSRRLPLFGASDGSLCPEEKRAVARPSRTPLPSPGSGDTCPAPPEQIKKYTYGD